MRSLEIIDLAIITAPVAAGALLRSMAVAGGPPRIMAIRLVPATSKVLGWAGVSLDDVGLVELNEAFAAQVLAVLHS